MNNFDSYKTNKHSQNGEDGIIEYLLSCIPEKDKICVEFGTLDGKECSNTFKLIEDSDYKAYYIEGDDKYFKLLTEFCSEQPNITPLHYYVGWEGENSLDNILKTAGLENKDFDVLSIDVDGVDYKIWEGLKEYNPKIVVIEINSGLSPYEVYSEEELTEEKLNYKETIYHSGRGVNFSTMVNLGTAKGYKLVVHTGNCIFIRDDLAQYIPEVKANYESGDDIIELFNRTWFGG